MIKNFDIANLAVASISDVRRVNHQADSKAQTIASHCALIIRKGGKSVYKFEKHSYTASSDKVLFIAKGTPYTLSVEKAGECTVVEFDVTDEALIACGLGNGGICEFVTTGDKTIYKLAKSLLQYFGLRGPAYFSKCMSELYSLVTQISTVHAYNHSLAGKYGLIHSSVKFIESNYAQQDLYTTMLADLSGIGETYYRNIFQAVFGMPPARYIQLYRVGKAKELLLNSELSIEEIAVAVGFANSSYFCKVFKSITDMTPSEFARKCSSIG
jgi:AraC-like DNA-binding protein